MTNNDYLPDFALQWMEQWKRAAAELPRIRDRELREMTDADALHAASVLDFQPLPTESDRENGLVIQQRWFMRQRLLELEKKRGKDDGASSTA